MHLMVYAPYGRTGIYMLQEFCRRLGIRATDEGIRDLIAALRSLPRVIRWKACCARLRIFAMRRHSRMHFCTRRIAHIPFRNCSISSSTAGMKFWPVGKTGALLPSCGVMAKIPQAARMAKLPMAEQYAAAELFRGTMVRHSAIVYRNDRSRDCRSNRFHWRRLAPVCAHPHVRDDLQFRSGCRPVRMQF